MIAGRDLFDDRPGCRCREVCTFPCWQRLGLAADPCPNCGCPPGLFAIAAPRVVAAGELDQLLREGRLA